MKISKIAIIGLIGVAGIIALWKFGSSASEEVAAPPVATVAAPTPAAPEKSDGSMSNIGIRRIPFDPKMVPNREPVQHP